MDEQEYNDWTHEACETCNRLLQDFWYLDDDEIPTKCLCIGRIIKPKNPKDEHEKLNEIRACLWDPLKSEGKACFDWTPYEAQTVATALSVAVGDYLVEFQPKKEP